MFVSGTQPTISVNQIVFTIFRLISDKLAVNFPVCIRSVIHCTIVSNNNKNFPMTRASLLRRFYKLVPDNLNIQKWEKSLHWLSERLVSLGIMGTLSRAPLNPSVRQCCAVRGGFKATLNLTPLLCFQSWLTIILAFSNDLIFLEASVQYGSTYLAFAQFALRLSNQQIMQTVMNNKCCNKSKNNSCQAYSCPRD